MVVRNDAGNPKGEVPYRKVNFKFVEDSGSYTKGSIEN